MMESEQVAARTGPKAPIADRAKDEVRVATGMPNVKPYATIQATSGLALNLKETWLFRDLLFTLATRDVKLRYKQTALGVMWVVLQPLLAAGIFSFVFGRVAKMPSDGIPYFLFAYAGQLGWNLFNNIVTRSSGCLVTNSQLISKIFFPRLILPLSTVPSALLDFGVAAVMMIALMIVYQKAPWLGLALLPVWTMILIILAMGIGLWLSALMVPYRDVQYILPVMMQLVLYGSPIAYATSAVPENFRTLFHLNPLSGLLDAFRWSILGTTPPPWGSVIYAAIVAVVMLVCGAFVFKKMERRFADVI